MGSTRFDFESTLFSSEWYDKENDQLKPGAPEEIQKEFSRYCSWAMAVDIVLCIEMTKYMSDFIYMLKENAMKLCDDIIAQMKNRYNGKLIYIREFRIKVIIFGDCSFDDYYVTLAESKFFEIPKETDGFRACIESIQPDYDAYNDYANGYEAIGCAIRSEWNKNSVGRKRHVIVVCTGNEAYGMGLMSPVYYPEGMTKDFDELSREWGSKSQPGIMDERAKRLLLFAAPGVMANWRRLSDNWNNVIFYETESWPWFELDYNLLIYDIVHSV